MKTKEREKYNLPSVVRQIGKSAGRRVLGVDDVKIPVFARARAAGQDVRSFIFFIFPPTTVIRLAAESPDKRECKKKKKSELINTAFGTIPIWRPTRIQLYCNKLTCAEFVGRAPHAGVGSTINPLEASGFHKMSCASPRTPTDCRAKRSSENDKTIHSVLNRKTKLFWFPKIVRMFLITYKSQNQLRTSQVFTGR